MTTREKVLALFESNRGVYFSGERAAEELNLSRTAVWKAVKSLQNDGYPIDAATKRGYRLSESTDILSRQGVEKYLRRNTANAIIEVVPKTASTNTLLQSRAAEGGSEGLTILSNEQTGGRGRFGRTFFSPKDTGIYMSLLLRPRDFTPEEAARLTTMAAVAVCGAVEDVCGETSSIKWVNDIYVRGKKVCGILTEGAYNIESGLLDYAILGFGVNIYPPENGFPAEIESIAGSILAARRPDAKNRLCAEILNRFFTLYRGNSDDYAEEYRRRCFVIGRHVCVISGGLTRNALVTGVDDRCRLLVEYENGSRDCLVSGDIRVKI